MKSKKIIDLSGYAFTGKSAVYDLLSEFRGYKCQSIEFEFELLRAYGGILDLEQDLVSNWSPVRSSEAIRKFKKLISVFGGTNHFFSRLTTHGYQYDAFFPNFTTLSNQYVDSLINGKWDSYWPFALNEYPFYRVFLKKILFRLGFKKAINNTVYLSRLNDETFTTITKDYLTQLFNSCMSETDTTLILNNGFEPFFPKKSHKFFNNAKSILVDRDPRDIYLAAKRSPSIMGTKVGLTAIGTSVDSFIKRFLKYRESNDNQTNNILHIRFENLVLNYEQTKSNIFEFLEESPDIHQYPLRFFNPEKSKAGIKLWKNITSDEKEEIEKISKELKDYCVNS